MGSKRIGHVSINKMTNGRFRVRWNDPLTGKDRSERYAQLGEAQRRAQDLSATIVTGTYVDPAAGKITLRKYIEESWRPAQTHSDATAELVERSFRLHVLPSLGAREINSLRSRDIRRLFAELKVSLAPTTCRFIFRYVSAVMNAAVSDRTIGISPCKGVPAPELPPNVFEPLTTKQVNALADAMPPRLRALVLFAATSGTRRGETAGLTVDRIIFDDRRVIINRQLKTVARGRTKFAPLKTRASYRRLPISDFTIQLLRTQLETFGSAGPEGFVFTDLDGQPLTKSRLSGYFRGARDQAGLPDVTMHDLRHYYASLLIRRGLSVPTVQARMGHKDATETLKTYSHLWDDSEAQTRDALDTEFAGIR